MALITNQYETTDRSFFIFREIEEHGYPGINIKLPFTQEEILSCKSAEDISHLLYRPYKNKRRHIMPFIFAFMEASRVVVQKNMYTDLNVGRNDYCPSYSLNLARFFKKLGLKAEKIDITTQAFKSPEYKNIIQIAYSYTKFLSPDRVYEMIRSFMTDPELLEVDFDLVKRKLTRPIELQLMDSDIKRWEIDVKSLLNFFKQEGILETLKSCALIPVTKTNNASHMLPAILVGDNIIIGDINNDQHQTFDITIASEYDESIDNKYTAYGINPIKDYPVLLPFEQALQYGHYPNKRELELINILDSKPSMIDPEDEIKINYIFDVMERGITIWDYQSITAEQLRKNSLHQNQIRKKLLKES